MKTVVNFGADPTGKKNSTKAFQDAVDSEEAIMATPGLFYIPDTVVFRTPKLFSMTYPLLQPFETDHLKRAARKPGPSIPLSHTRLWTDTNNVMFEIQSPQVFITGGAFDTQKAFNRTNPIIRYVNGVDHNNRANGWGGHILDFLLLGNYLELGNTEGGGCDGILIDFNNSNITDAYWTHMHWRGRVAGLRCGWKSTPRNFTLGHWANNSRIELDVDYTKQAIYNESFSGLKATVRHQGRHCFANENEMENTPSVYSYSDIELYDQKFFDFGKEPVFVDRQRTKLWYFNNYSIELEGTENIIDDSDFNTYSRKKYLGSTKPKHRLDNAQGLVIRRANNQRNSVVIQELHDCLYEELLVNLNKHVIKGYVGRNNLELLTEPTTSLESTGITLARTDMMFRMNGTFTEFTWTEEAAANNDYVELVLQCNRSIKDLWVVFAGTPKALQVILRNTSNTQISPNQVTHSSSQIITNQIREMRPRKTLEPIAEQFIVPVETFNQIIIRFIGCYGTKIQPNSIIGMDTRHKWRNPFMVV